MASDPKQKLIDKSIQMLRVRHCYARDQRREYLIVRLMDIWRPIELVPLFGGKCPRHWDSSNAVELAKEFYVNSFFSKEVYQSVY